MKTLHVELGARSYPIYIGSDLMRRRELFSPHIVGRQVMIVSNETVAPLYLNHLRAALTEYDCAEVVLPDGEEYKTLDILNLIFDALLAHRFDRQSTIVALGGGVIGDMAGFAAACYQRGVHFIQVPTTLLAQVDSSVGGKTGVNHRLGKNMVGAFYQPKCVVADISVLNTLDDRQLRAGVAEVIKYGLIRDPEFFQWLEDNVTGILNCDPALLSEAVERSCRNKAAVVAADELEGGVRALLNLGHTFGHAIETGLGYGVWLHGEAVAAGMHIAAVLSQRLGWITEDDVARVRALLKRSGLPVHVPKEMSTTRFLELMAVDKKVQQGRLRLVLLQAIGRAIVTDQVTTKDIGAAIDACRNGVTR